MFNLILKEGYTLQSEKHLLSLPRDKILGHFKLIHMFFQRKLIDETDISFLIQCISTLLNRLIKNNDTLCVDEICKLLLNIADTYPAAFIAELKRVIAVGELQGSSILFVLFNNFYIETFNSKNQNYPKALIQIFSTLSAHPDFKTLSMHFNQVNLEGLDKDHSSLWIFSQALVQATHAPFCVAHAFNMAKFYQRIILSLNQSGLLSMTRKITEGPYQGKSIVYSIACALKEASRANNLLCASLVDSVQVICDLFKAIHEAYPQELLSILDDPIDAGPDEGHTPLHIILLSLVTAAHIYDNQKTVDAIIALVENVIQTTDRETIRNVFQRPISSGFHRGKTGMDLLNIAKEKGGQCRNQTETLVQLIEKLNSDERLVSELEFSH